MSIRVAINHLTRYEYDKPVNIGPHLIRLRPAPHSRTPILSYSLNIKPTDHFINWQQDSFGNYVARCVFPEKSKLLEFEVELVADMTVINPFNFFVDDSAREFPFSYDKALKTELAPYLLKVKKNERITDWLKQFDLQKPTPINDFLVMLNQQLQRDIHYLVRMEPGVQSCDTTLRKRSGSCRDSAWLFVQIFRHLGLAARFVSGYLIQLKADQKALDGPSGTTQDFTDLHAWTEVYVPGAGWIGLDPTSGLFAAEGHIPLACTPQPTSAAAISGAVDKAETEFYFHNKVTRVQETPRVTKPYDDDQWQRILDLGDRIDQQMQADNLRLTMGGEPTFVSIDDMDGDEWNTAALGEDKRDRAEKLVRRLQNKFAPDSLLHTGQGKWYPGEQLPRWALSLFWRKDQEAVWQNPDLLAHPNQHHDHENQQAEAFLIQLADRLKVPENAIRPGYEDNWYYLWKEGELPDNLTPMDNKLDDPLERERIRKVFDRGLNTIKGYALPLKHQSSQWQTTDWTFRRGNMYLIPGDSAMGFRLPIQSLKYTSPGNRPQFFDADPFEQQKALARFGAIRPELRFQNPIEQMVSDGADTAASLFEHKLNLNQPVSLTQGDYISTAMTAEVRDGQLYVFMPPVETLEGYLELVHAIEHTANDLQLPVVIEGYEPPVDQRLNKLSVTPDPGVIEVNIHPSSSWREIINKNQILYEEARQSRLGTEKFMLDGRHTGTGGGNHITMGGNTTADSPFLQRPDLLRSLITYWQHHPSLSYLFSGMFIGPTSQAPRVDEARDDNLYELETALQQIQAGNTYPLWHVDRVLRNFLTDLTGNTHRAEFCIDKLYSPDGPTGRLGIVELRNFEMPPHERMSGVQQLLMRSLVSKFWQQPYHHPLLPWGTQLHDRYMLPHFVETDINAVIRDLNQDGIEFESDWMDPFLEFRFPLCGEMQFEDAHLEVRHAIEPWHVLGEESTGQGTARYVDSSVERVQVKVTGLSPRYEVHCNQRKVPLQNTFRVDERVAGVRFKAWKPYSSLHPTLNTDVPLVFDIYDTFTDKALAGCTYYVSHPGGRSYDTFPVNANEAEARRQSRFVVQGHTPNTDKVQTPDRPSQYFPYTLDLRT